MNTASPGANWNSNGVVTISSGVDSFNWGSLMLIPAVPAASPVTDLPQAGTSSSDYEINTTLSVKSGATGTYVQFLRANSATVQPGTGNYIAVKLTLPTGFTAPGAATIAVSSLIGGTSVAIGSASVTAADGMTLRSVIFGTNLLIYVNNVAVLGVTVPSMTGNPGIGGIGMASNSGFTSVLVGRHDILAPNPVPVSSVASSVFPTSVSLRWPGIADDTNGIGVWIYWLYRNGVPVAPVVEPEYVDTTVAPGTTYIYTIYPEDFHGNPNAGTNVTVTTPPANSIDPHRTGIYTTGSYWGGGGEQIDTLSGNLNFSLPLLTAQGRPGWTVPVNLVYNSQNWRNDNGVNWSLGYDVGYGYGWQAMIGSITPYYPSMWSAVDHYVYTDGTGAQYMLNVNSGGVWSSTQSVYVWLDTTVTPNKLHFRDGMFWVLGSTSGGTEADAGTMYPTIVEDVSGNQVIVTYDSGAGLPATGNTSARIVRIEDSRAVPATPPLSGYVTYTFNYSGASPVSHLTALHSWISNTEGGTFTYASGVLTPAFGGDPHFTSTVSQLTSFVMPNTSGGAGTGTYSFTYDPSGSQELDQVTFPWGGHLRWSYQSFEYSGVRMLREVANRYLSASSTGSIEWTYPLTRPDASNSVTVHSAMTLTDASGIGAKTWSFQDSAGSSSAWQIGLITDFRQLSAPAVTNAIKHDEYTWSRDPAGSPYISAKTTISDEATSNAQSALSTQTLDQYGNVTQSAIYPYNNTTTPLNTWTNTYLNSGTYISNYIRNRLLTASLTTMMNGPTPGTLITNTYDVNYDCTYTIGYTPGAGSACAGWSTPTTSPTREIDSSPPIPIGARGYLSKTVTPSLTTWVNMYTYGAVAQTTGSDGSQTTGSADSATNYAAPQTLTTQSYQTAVSYNSWLGVTSTTGLNGETLTMTYDNVGRPLTGTSPYGAVTTYAYSDAHTGPPFWQTKTGPDGYTKTILDGLGRAITVLRGPNSSTIQSEVDTIYGPCACSPLAKVSGVTQPYAPGGSAVYTNYFWDGIGRARLVELPDGASMTSYSYSGNQTTVTDPKGNWKTFTSDVLGNLATVAEPDPASGTVYTNYAYDWMGHVFSVLMNRGSASQTRTFIYDIAGRLTSATNPESGTVSYVYSSDNTLQYKTDAKLQQTVYSYDSQKRLTMTQYFPTGQANPEDGCQRVTYSYDTNPINPGFSLSSYGRLTAIRYGANTNGGATNPFCVSGEWTNYLAWGTYTNTMTNFAEMYSYHPAGAITAKQLYVSRQPAGGSATNMSLEVDYTYDSAGRTATMTYPMASPFFSNAVSFPSPSLGPVTFTYGYDSMGRPNALTDSSGITGSQWDLGTGGGPINWAQNVQYDVAGRMTSAQFMTTPNYTGSYNNPAWTQQTMSYNVNGQLTGLYWAYNPHGTGYGTPAGIQYNYSATQNNGQITQAVDMLSGETISYQYDSLKRLTQASSMPISGSSPAAYMQTYQYDGFGNLTAKVLNGTTTPIGVNPANNQLSSASYDANGNMISGSGAGPIVYDEANRMFSAQATSGPTEYYDVYPGLLYRV